MNYLLISFEMTRMRRWPQHDKNKRKGVGGTWVVAIWFGVARGVYGVADVAAKHLGLFLWERSEFWIYRIFNRVKGNQHLSNKRQRFQHLSTRRSFRITFHVQRLFTSNASFELLARSSVRNSTALDERSDSFIGFDGEYLATLTTHLKKWTRTERLHETWEIQRK